MISNTVPHMKKLWAGQVCLLILMRAEKYYVRKQIYRFMQGWSVAMKNRIFTEIKTQM